MTPEPSPLVEVDLAEPEETAEFPAVSAPGIPFRLALSLEPLVEFWQREAEENRIGLAQAAGELLEELEAAPELRGDQADLGEVRRHPRLVAALFSVILPPGLPRMSFGAVVAPWGNDHFHMTPRFRSTFFDSSGQPLYRPESQAVDFDRLKAVFAHILVLGRIYEVQVPIVLAPHLVVTDPATGIDCYFQLRVHLEHLRVKCLGEPPPLDQDLLAALYERPTDLDLWHRLLPGDRFEVTGFMVQEATEVTAEVALSRLKQLLIERDPLGDPGRYRELERCVRALLKQPDGRLFLAVLQDGRAYFIHPEASPPGVRLEERAPCLTAEEVGSLQDRGILGQACSVSVCRACSGEPTNGLERALARSGLSRALVAPLEYDGRTVGFMAVATNEDASLATMEALRLGGVFQLFALAVHNATMSMRDRVQAVIMENFTAIHPTVAWRFQQAALRHLRGHDDHGEIEPIVFSEVFPLYGVSDIRSSSEIRSRAIQEDMVEQLRLARVFLREAHRSEPLPYVAHLESYVARSLASIDAQGLHSGDEVRLLEFLRREVEPLFECLGGDAEVEAAIAAYRGGLDPELGFFYRARKDFEDSLGRVRELVGAILLEEQERAQAIFPHYFEMHKTDGVDHMMYVGQCLTETPGFGQIHLRSLRIWQLQAMARVARETEELRGSLPLSLGTAHLVLVQEMPLAIRFMMDDRRFDVDGAYNARYEIVKKRLDKAEIRGTRERLTQPGHVAIVYSHPREAVEYREYLHYLADSGLIEPEIEQLELHDLQGVQGLRALRVRVRQA